MSGQPFHQPAVLVAANGGAERGLGERGRQLRPQHIRRVHPAVLVVRNGDGLALRRRARPLRSGTRRSAWCSCRTAGAPACAAWSGRRTASLHCRGTTSTSCIPPSRQSSSDRAACDNSCQLPKPSMRGDAADRNGQNAAAATPDDVLQQRDVVRDDSRTRSRRRARRTVLHPATRTRSRKSS